jgi:hypothetical protein
MPVRKAIEALAKADALPPSLAVDDARQRSTGGSY